MMVARIVVPLMLALLTTLVMVTTALAHGGEEGESATSYSVYALIPASVAVLVTVYIMYRISRGRRT
jgi:hypothetical protein